MKGKTSIAEDLVFPSKAGTVLDHNNLTHDRFLPCLEHAGLRRFRFHDLHTFGSLLIQDGASLAYVKDQMGHRSIQITVAHLRPPHSRSGHRVGGPAGFENNPGTTCNPPRNLSL
jgi:integrase